MKSFPRSSIVTLLCLFLSWDVSATAANNKSGTDAQSTAGSSSADTTSSSSEFIIPGPLRSFLRMAGISQEISPSDVLPLLSWSVSTIGYQHNHPTEYLILLTRYVAQGRELAALAGKGGVIRISGCQDADPLLRILGYLSLIHI